MSRWSLLAFVALSQAPLVLEDSGFPFTLDNSATPSKHQIETMIGGVAVFDFNNDQKLDLYFANGARLPAFDKSDPRFHNRLFRNEGGGKFTDVTDKAGVRGVGYGMGVASADYDNDGFADLYVTGIRQNQLFHNNGNGTFTDVTQKAGDLAKLTDTYRVGAGWFDYNNDGRLDLFVVQYLRWKFGEESECAVNGISAYCSPKMFDGMPNLLFRNEGNGAFTDVSKDTGIAKHIGKGMSVSFADYDGDRWTDIFVANDTFRNFLFRNRGNGGFTETGLVAGVGFNENGEAIAGMGSDFRDLDNDGRADIFLTGMFGDTFPVFRNQGQQFTDVTSLMGLVRATHRLTGWSAGAIDFNNDGRKDLFTANSAILDNAEQIDHLPYKQQNVVMISEESGYRPFAIGKAAAHRGAAFGDMDNDGRVDVVTSSLNSPAELFWNRTAPSNHWLIFDLRGRRSNRDGLGAVVTVTLSDGRTLTNHATTAVGYASSSDKRVHFGLGTAAIKSVRVQWPSGAVQSVTEAARDTIVRVVEPE